jgi:DinB superfamily
MKNVAGELAAILEKYHPLFRSMPEERQTDPLIPDAWSRKQELGHLVDSAQNNIQRFVRVQYQAAVKISYNPDEWVRINDYEHWPWTDLVALWYLLNKQIVRILTAMPADANEKPVDVGAQEPVVHPLSYIANDYTVHLQHHLDHIFVKLP